MVGLQSRWISLELNSLFSQVFLLENCNAPFGREQVITTQLTFWKMANIVETDLADEARPAPEENKKYRMIWWVAAQVIKQIIVVSFYLIQDGWRKLCWVGEADGAGRGGRGGGTFGFICRACCRNI